MSGCPTSEQTVFDIRKTKDCVAILRELHGAYVALVAGTRPIEVRHNERWTTYNKGNAAALLDLYIAHWNQCPRAAQAGMPDLNPNNAVRRGGPARNFHEFFRRF